MFRRLMVMGLAIAAASAPAHAAVSIEFYSRELGNYFPHAFIVYHGHPDDDPRPVDGNIGFTAVSVSPSILMGPVKGIVEPAPNGYIAGSVRMFTVQVTDAQWARVRTLIAEWQALPQPSYDLHKKNCVSFTAAVARELGLKADDDLKLITKPHAFLTKVRLDNPVLGDGQTTVTAQAIAQANGGHLPAATPAPALARTAPPAPVAAQPASATTRYKAQPALSAAAIAAGYRPSAGNQ